MEPIDNKIFELVKNADELTDSLSADSDLSMHELDQEQRSELREFEACLQYLASVRDLCQRESIDINDDLTVKRDSSVLPDEDSIPSHFGRFLIEGVLGSGGFATVFLATDPKLGRLVALKVLKPSALADPDAKLRFEREAQAAATLNHPAIVPVYEFGQVGPVSYIVYAYCDGKTLAERIKGETSLAVFESVELIATVADALQHAHQRGIVHRDIKPSNILFDSDKALLGDFGLVKSESSTDQAITITGGLIGTPAYMSPEQVRGDREIGPESDIHALGLVLFEMLTGENPFRKMRHLDTLKAIELEEPIFDSRHNTAIPRDLQAIVLKCLEKKPGNRYSSAYAFGEDLECWISGKPVRARKSSGLTRGLRWVGRNRMVSTAIAIATISLFSAAIVSSYHWGQAQSNLTRLENESERADIHRRRTERAIDELLDEFSGKILELPKSPGLQVEMLTKALDLQNEILAQENDDNFSRSHRVLEIQSRIAALQVALGQYADAELSIVRGLALGKARLKDDGVNVRDKTVQILATLLGTKGRLLIAQDRHLDAVETLESAMQLVHDYRLEKTLADELRDTLFVTGRALAETTEFESAKHYLTAAMELSDWDDPKSNLDLSRALNEMAIVHKRNRRFDQADAAQMLAIQIHENLPLELARKADVKMNHAAALNNLGNSLAAQKRWDEAEPRQRAAVAIVESVVNDRPDVVSFGANLLTMKNALGVTLKNLDRFDDAIQVYKSAIEFGTKFVERHRDPVALMNFVKNQNNLANLLIMKNEGFSEAVEYLNHSLLATEELSDFNGPKKLEILFSRSYAFDRLTKIAALRGDYEQARLNSDQAVETARQVYESNGIDHRYRKNVIIVLCQSDRIAKQFLDYERSIKSLRELAEFDGSINGTVNQLRRVQDLRELLKSNSDNDETTKKAIAELAKRLVQRMKTEFDTDADSLPDDVRQFLIQYDEN